MKAKLIYRRKIADTAGNIQEMVIWKLPHKTSDRPHGIKYRCYYGNDSGHCIVRYDNEAGKGDHKHIGDEEEPYQFTSVEQLMRDFLRDIYIYRLSRREKLK